MSTAKFCIKHKVTTLLAVIMIAIFGLVFTTQLQMALLPNMEYPAAVVICYYNGASPSDMEELVTRPLEAAVMSVPGVDEVQSVSSDSTTQIQITYVDGTDVDIAATKLREQFDMVSLPDGAIDPVIVNMNISDMMPTAMVALMGDDLAQLQTMAEDTVVPALVSRNRIRVKERDGKSETGKGRESQSYQGKQRTSMRRPPRRGRALSSSTRTAARGSSGGFLYA